MSGQPVAILHDLWTDLRNSSELGLMFLRVSLRRFGLMASTITGDTGLCRCQRGLTAELRLGENSSKKRVTKQKCGRTNFI